MEGDSRFDPNDFYRKSLKTSLTEEEREMRNKLKIYILSILTSLFLLLLGARAFYLNWLQKPVRYDRNIYAKEAAERLRNYPKIQFNYGLNAWARQDPEAAARFFRQAVSKDVLFLDSWLRLAEAEATLGRKEKAIQILTYTIDRTRNVSRWKWPQMLLARDLGMEDVIYRNANYLLSRGVFEQDTLHFLHTHLGGNASDVVAILEPGYLKVYLEWLMNWSMTEESLTVWQVMNKISTTDKDTALRYANFLLNNKRIVAAMDLWKQYNGYDGLTNPGFENDITGKGFDWRHWGENDGNWELKRVNDENSEGGYALRITFNGRENISFYHFYQIFTVDQLEKYRLTYAWKSQGISTDKTPFIEIYSYNNDGLYMAGPMIADTQGWSEVSLEFDVPEGCRAAVVRLCRQPSNRFDSKIRGSLWLDDFRLEKIKTDSLQSSSKISTAGFQPGALQNKNLYENTR
jgi:tetratricopeptide (TPR) repeat protein